MAPMRKAVDRYLRMLTFDAKVAANLPLPAPVTAMLEELYGQDRLPEGVEPRPEKPEQHLRTRAREFVRKLVDFANVDLEDSKGPAQVFVEAQQLSALIPHFFPRDDFRSVLPELQREMRRILRSMALSDRWCDSDAFLRLWSNLTWNPPRRDRSGLEIFAESDLANDRTGVASTGQPISIHLHWSWDGDKIQRLRLPTGWRDSLLLAFDDAVALLGPALRVPLCAVCRRLFVPRKRQLYWPNECKQRANEFLRDHDTESNPKGSVRRSINETTRRCTPSELAFAPHARRTIQDDKES
jgi:hypothetical protein